LLFVPAVSERLAKAAPPGGNTLATGSEDNRSTYTSTCITLSVLRIRLQIHRIHMFLSLPDPDPLVRGMNPDPDPSIIMQK
jgi:hypothetical protein